MANSSDLAAVGIAAALVLSASSANAQTFAFERTFPAAAATTLDVATDRGKITVRAGSGPDVVVVGRVTVRRGFTVPADAVTLARAAANQPPVEQSGNVVRLHLPSDARTRRAVTVAYEVHLPSHVPVTTNTESGETVIDGIHGSVSVRTQSASVTLSNLEETEVNTGSGHVTIDGAGPLRVSTSSSGIRLRQIRDELFIRTQSGNVNASLSGEGDVDVETGSSAITIEGIDGGLAASTQSGKVRVAGKPRRPWQVTTGSSAIETEMASAAMFNLEATSGSGSVKTENLMVRGETDKRRVAGTIDGGGPMVRLNTRSGAIKVRSAGSPNR
jgi:hypothetical protein